MPVFISHRTQDDYIAQGVYRRLNGVHGIQCYLDDFDPDADPTNGITQTILDNLERSTHLLAIVTNNTRGSWWVPFEIGVARHGARRISSYDSSTQPLPEFLKEWPVLSGDSAVDQFAFAYKRDGNAARIRRGVRLEGVEIRTQLNAADAFHADLKRSLASSGRR